MLFKSMNLLKNTSIAPTTASFMGMSARGFASAQNLGGNFSFPKHKEFFNDEYYGEESAKSPFSKNAAGPKTMQDDFVDPNNPFISESLGAPGGILASYKKRLGLSAKEVMEQGYWDKMRDIRDEASEYFDVVGKSERDMMNNTKNYSARLRLNRQIEFSEDFRKRFMTREYGNYEKYEEGRNSVGIETEKGENDEGFDKLMKNEREMNMRLNTEEGQEAIEEDKLGFEEIITDETYADQTIKDRLIA